MLTHSFYLHERFSGIRHSSHRRHKAAPPNDTAIRQTKLKMRMSRNRHILISIPTNRQTNLFQCRQSCVIIRFFRYFRNQLGIYHLSVLVHNDYGPCRQSGQGAIHHHQPVIPGKVLATEQRYGLHVLNAFSRTKASL